MSSAESTKPDRPCPLCKGPMEQIDTICTQCRAQLEADVLAVRSGDFPEPAASPTEPTDDLGVPVSAMDHQLAAAVVEDAELLPLAPNESRRSQASGTALATPPVATAPPPSTARPPSGPAAAAPAPRPAPAPKPAPTPVVERPISLQSPSRWKLVLILLVCLAVVAVLAAVLWSTIVPKQAMPGGASESRPPAASQPSP